MASNCPRVQNNCLGRSSAGYGMTGLQKQIVKNSTCATGGPCSSEWRETKLLGEIDSGYSPPGPGSFLTC